MNLSETEAAVRTLLSQPRTFFFQRCALRALLFRFIPSAGNPSRKSCPHHRGSGRCRLLRT